MFSSAGRSPALQAAEAAQGENNNCQLIQLQSALKVEEME